MVCCRCCSLHKKREICFLNISFVVPFCVLCHAVSLESHKSILRSCSSHFTSFSLKTLVFTTRMYNSEGHACLFILVVFNHLVILLVLHNLCFSCFQPNSLNISIRNIRNYKTNSSMHCTLAEWRCIS